MEDQSETCAHIKQVSTWNSGGDINIDIVELQDGQVLAITEDSVVLYKSMEELERGDMADRPMIFL